MEDIQTIPAGRALFKAGQLCKSLFIVKSGKVALLKEVKGRLFRYPNVERKEFLGHLNAFDGSKHEMSAITLEDTEIYEIKVAEIGKVLKSCPDWISDIMSTLTDRLSHSMDIVSEHKIGMDDSCELTPEEENRFRKILND